MEMTQKPITEDERIVMRYFQDPPAMLHRTLSSDDMDILGRKLFDYEKSWKLLGSMKINGLKGDQLETLIVRLASGESIAAELGQGLFDISDEFDCYDDNYNSHYIQAVRTENGITFSYKSISLTMTWEEIGEAYIAAARAEYIRHMEAEFIGSAVSELAENRSVRFAYGNADSFSSEIEKGIDDFF